MLLAGVVAEVTEEREGERVCMLWSDLQPLHSIKKMEEMLRMEEEWNGGIRNIKSNNGVDQNDLT